MTDSHDYRVLNPDGVSRPDGSFVQAVITSGLVFVSGQASVDLEGRVVGAGDVRVQTRQTLENLRTILEAAGSNLGRVTKLTWYLIDISERAAVAEVRREFWPEGTSLPTSTLVEISRLALPELRVEVEAIAALAAP